MESLPMLTVCPCNGNDRSIEKIAIQYKNGTISLLVTCNRNHIFEYIEFYTSLEIILHVMNSSIFLKYIGVNSKFREPIYNYQSYLPGATTIVIGNLIDVHLLMIKKRMTFEQSIGHNEFLKIIQKG